MCRDDMPALTLMPNDKSKLQATRMIMTAAAVVVVVSGLKLAQAFFIPVLLAGESINMEQLG